MKNSSLLFGLLTLIYMLGGCAPAPGGDTRQHTFSVAHTGIATITNTYTEEETTFIDILFSVENINHGEPQPYTGINTKRLGGADSAPSIAVNDKLSLTAMHIYERRGTSTPVLLKTLWQLNR